MTRIFRKRNFSEWTDDEIAETLRESGGDIRGGSEVLVIESNQNHATVKETEVCNALPASMGCGGGYVPMILEGR